jgi:hypothetical protein
MDSDFQSIAARITDECAAHTSDMKTFHAVYLAEIRGFFEVHTETVQAAFHQMIPPDAPRPTKVQLELQSQLLTNVFSNIFKYGKAGTSCPQLRLSLACTRSFDGTTDSEHSTPTTSTTFIMRPLLFRTATIF